MSNHQAAIEFSPVSPVARNSDPASSHAAARQVTRDGTRKRQADEVLRLVRAHPGLTSYEYADHSEAVGRDFILDRYQIARRLGELADPKNGGLLVRGDSRVCGISGREALTWFPVMVREVGE